MFGFNFIRINQYLPVLSCLFVSFGHSGVVFAGWGAGLGLGAAGLFHMGI